jgi:hypothetical protein
MGTTAAIVGASALGGTLGLLGSEMQSSAIEKGAATSSDATKYAAELQYAMWQEQQRMMKPWRTAGESALNKLSAAGIPSFYPDQYKLDPGYQFRLEQGVNALNASGAAGGYLGSGNLGTALVGYGQELGSQEYQNAYNRYMNEQNTYYNRLAGIAGIGQTSSEYLAGAGGTAAANMGNLAVGGANALAAGQTGAANAWAGGIQNLSNQFMGGLGTYLNYQQQQQMINALKMNQGYSPYSSYVAGNPAYDSWNSWDYSGTPVVGGGTW